MWAKAKKEVRTEQISEFCPQFAHQTKNLYKTLTGGSAPLLKPETSKKPAARKIVLAAGSIDNWGTLIRLQC